MRLTWKFICLHDCLLCFRLAFRVFSIGGWGWGNGGGRGSQRLYCLSSKSSRWCSRCASASTTFLMTSHRNWRWHGCLCKHCRWSQKKGYCCCDEVHSVTRHLHFRFAKGSRVNLDEQGKPLTLFLKYTAELHVSICLNKRFCRFSFAFPDARKSRSKLGSLASIFYPQFAAWHAALNAAFASGIAEPKAKIRLKIPTSLVYMTLYIVLCTQSVVFSAVK